MIPLLAGIGKGLLGGLGGILSSDGTLGGTLMGGLQGARMGSLAGTAENQKQKQDIFDNRSPWFDAILGDNSGRIAAQGLGDMSLEQTPSPATETAALGLGDMPPLELGPPQKMSLFDLPEEQMLRSDLFTAFPSRKRGPYF